MLNVFVFKVFVDVVVDDDGDVDDDLTVDDN
jgi:hypothetical protein